MRALGATSVQSSRHDTENLLELLGIEFVLRRTVYQQKSDPGPYALYWDSSNGNGFEAIGLGIKAHMTHIFKRTNPVSSGYSFDKLLIEAGFYWLKVNVDRLGLIRNVDFNTIVLSKEHCNI